MDFGRFFRWVSVDINKVGNVCRVNSILVSSFVNMLKSWSVSSFLVGFSVVFHRFFVDFSSVFCRFWSRCPGLGRFGVL